MALIYDRHLWSRQYFDPSCPSGGSWYACTTGSRFVGCCTGDIDPCNATTSCPQKNLKPASFNISDYGTFPDQTCSSGSNWYTCTGTDPAFMGCCKSNPCSNGCPTSNLTAAKLSSNEAKASPFTITTSAAATSAAASSSSIDSAAVSSAAATSAAATTTAASATSAAASSTASDNAGAIAGGVVGGLAGLALILIGILWWLKRVKQARQKKLEQYKMESPADNGDGYFHENLRPVSEAHCAQGPPPETGYSQEDPEGIEVDHRPPQSAEQGNPADPYLTVKSQSTNVSRSPSGSSNWFYRNSLAPNGPIYPLQVLPSSNEERPVSWFDAPPSFINNDSPVVTPIQSQSPQQTDYFGTFDTRQRPVSYELSSAQAAAIAMSPRSPTSPQTQYFELDDTQRSPPVELDTTEWGQKTKDAETTAHTAAQHPEHKNEEEDTPNTAPFSPDDVGMPRSRD